MEQGNLPPPPCLHHVLSVRAWLSVCLDFASCTQGRGRGFSGMVDRLTCALHPRPRHENHLEPPTPRWFQASQLHIDRDAEIARRLQEAGCPERGGVPRPPSEHDPLAGSLMSPEMIAQQMAALQRLEAARATSGAGTDTDADADAAADSDGSYDC